MRRASFDRTLLILTLVIGAVGMLIFFSASLSLLPKGNSVFAQALIVQLVLGLGGGLGALYLLAHTPLLLLKRFAPHVFLFSLILTAAVFLPVIGVSANGARRWIDLGVVTFQPSELLKIGYVLFLASFLSAGRDRGGDVMRGIVPFLVLSCLTAILLLLQPDTDTFLITIGAGVAMLFASGLTVRDTAIGLLLGVLALGSLIALRPYLLERVLTFADPSRDPLGSGYQIQQSLIAVGSGDVWGRGYGQSIQKFNYLPEASSDAIFAVYAEEFGFVGSVLLVFLFLSYILRGLWVSARAQDLYGALVALGLIVLIGGQAFMNIAAMIGLIPVGGLPLPFVSKGGSALLMSFAMAGLILAVSKTTRR